MQPYILSHFSQVCIHLLNHYFGEAVGKVGSYLLRRGNRPMFEIPDVTGLHLREVRKALAIMIQHNLVRFAASEKNPNFAEYSVIPEHIYRLLRYSKYLYMVKVIYSVAEEILLEVLLNLGQASASTIIFQAANRLKEANGDDNESMSPAALHEHFIKLAKNEFIIRCHTLKTSSDEAKIPQFTEEENIDNYFKVPEIDLRNLGMKFRENAQSLGEHSDSNVIWRVNHERFDIQMRHVILTSAAERRIDSTAGELYSILLKQWHEISARNSPVTNLLSFNQIKDAVRRNDSSSPTLLEHFDQYMRVLFEDSSDFVTKSGDAGGGQFVLNYTSVFQNLTAATLDSIVLEKFGSKALRIFRLVRMQRYMEQDPLQNLSMIPAKEAKFFTYKLMENNFLQLKEMKKGTSNMAPVKSFILFYVDLPHVARTALELAYKGLFNAMVRREHEITTNKRMLDKHERMESLLATLRAEEAPEDELAYVADSMSSTEKSLVARIQAMSDNVTLGLSQVDETVLILETYLSLIGSK